MKERLENKILHYKYILCVLRCSQDARQENTTRFVKGEIADCEQKLRKLKRGKYES